MILLKTDFVSLILLISGMGVTAEAQDRGVPAIPKSLSANAASGPHARDAFALRDGDTIMFLGDSITAARTYRFAIRAAKVSQKRKRQNVSQSKLRSNANARQGNRVASMSSSQRQSALADLPHIDSFRDSKSNRFLVDLDVVRTGHPYKGKNAKRPHTGGHVYFKAPTRQLSADDVESYPAIYAVADGVISRIDYSFRLREMFEPALDRRVANTRYGIGLMFAKRDQRPVEMHYSIEPFIDPEDDRFYDKFILVKPGQRVRKGDVIARMYIPPNMKLAVKSHIHFNLMSGKPRGFMAPAIFSKAIVQRFHATWGNRGTDGMIAIPPCMGYRLAPNENPFEYTAEDAL